MKAVIQRVKRARVQSGSQEAIIGPGLLVLVGLETGDTEETCAWAAAKLASLRIFEDEDGKMNRGLQEVGGEILAVSQFTLAGSIAKGRRPSFDGAMAPEAARELFHVFLGLLKAQHPAVKTGFFQEHMEVELVNDGPVTFILER
ncbi:D-aminoacyl-tRNA deacylase [Geothrix sp. PMB-07]|uniref:D-aminoacyl-tRNA deacylase n=1 Tax=Geothrix sp. PMB-07 TaxID=3068640 RepID=UPI002741D749|nr:D-aminoacyl-tRNA deacylase [Geothrix sp. PMB-07]WLT32596.1 D-aminoacyl-tRNA deacylase [Geothrix sp. PMB-07]